MSINLLLWEKWRPKKMEDIILLPRIRNEFQNGVNQNYIFHGHFGTGKTTLARILVGRYSKDKAYIELNSSLSTSINTLRSEIEDFCKFTPMLDSDSDIKYVFLDEFERSSAEFQDGFKAFVEKYHKNVRFIITTNHINKVIPGIRSRFTEINFDCLDTSEEKYLKQEIFKRINNDILPSEQAEIPKESLIQIVTKKFPDFRATLIGVQNYINSGGESIGGSNVSTKVKSELYDLIFKKDISYDKIYHFLMGGFGADKVDVLISLLGRPFVDWVISNHPDKIEKLFESNYVIADYTSELKMDTDPIILGLTIVGKFRDIFLD